MNKDSSSHVFQPYKAPRQDGQALITPESCDWPGSMQRNVEIAKTAEVSFLGKSLQDSRMLAREHLIRSARAYTGQYLSTDVDGSSIERIVMGGHQPQLFHAGVWFKNFALSRAAEMCDASAVNLVVDNDLCGARSVRIPEVHQGQIRLASIAYDDPSDPIAFEQAAIGNMSTFAGFADQVCEKVDRLSRHLETNANENPSVVELWQQVMQANQTTKLLGAAIAAGRHRLEHQLGLRTLEVPVSVVSQCATFQAFVIHLAQNAPALHEIHNQTLEYYRSAHRIRSRAHPVPALQQQGHWWELPFWIYSPASPRRRGLYVRRTANALEFSDLNGGEFRLDFSGEWGLDVKNFAVAAESYKVRPRALTLTMYSRLLLADLFFHGIGGGKYDQLTDLMIRGLFNLQPPEFVVLSATYTPWSHALTNQAASSESLEREVRETRYHGERYTQQGLVNPTLADRKTQLLQSIPPRGQKQAWHDEITDLSTRMSGELAPLRAELHQRLRQAKSLESEQRLLRSREYPFCIYPLKPMGDALQQLLPEVKTSSG